MVYKATLFKNQYDAGWSSLVARWAHNPKVGGSNPPPATNKIRGLEIISKLLFFCLLTYFYKPLILLID